jgi:hypothetical protein
MVAMRSMYMVEFADGRLESYSDKRDAQHSVNKRKSTAKVWVWTADTRKATCDLKLAKVFSLEPTSFSSLSGVT